MKREVVLILLGKFAPTLLALGLTASFGLAEFGAFRLHLSQAFLVMGLVSAGFLPAFLAYSRRFGRAAPSVAWIFLILASILVGVAMLAILQPAALLTSALMVLVAFLITIAESRTVLQKRAAVSAFVSLAGGSVFYLAFWCIRLVTETLETAAFLSVLVGLLSLLAMNSYIHLTSPLEGDDRPASLSLMRWAYWQSQFMVGPGVARLYINLIPVVAGYVSSAEAVGVVTLAIAVGTIFSFLPTRYLQINLGVLTRHGSAGSKCLDLNIIARLRRVRLLSLAGSVLSLGLIYVAADWIEGWMGREIGLFNYLWAVLGFLVYPVINTLIGPAGTILAQTGHHLIVQRNAVAGGGVFILGVYLIALYAPNSVFLFGIVYLFARVLNDFLNLCSIHESLGKDLKLSLVSMRNG